MKISSFLIGIVLGIFTGLLLGKMIHSNVETKQTHMDRVKSTRQAGGKYVDSLRYRR